MKNKLLILLFVLAFSNLFAQNNFDEPLSYFCQKTYTAINIDGVLDKQWDNIEWTEDFVDITGDMNLLPNQQTKVKMQWDDTYLYIACKINEEHIWAKLKQHDTVIFYDNDFEVFIDPEGDAVSYYEIEVNALNTIWDLYLERPYRSGVKADNSWESGVISAVSINGTLNNPSDIDSCWYVEMAIPWTSFDRSGIDGLFPYIGENFRINFSRVNWDVDIVKGINANRYQKVIKPGEIKPIENNWVWSKQNTVNMHKPEYWAYVYFIDSISIDKADYFDNDSKSKLQLFDVFVKCSKDYKRAFNNDIYSLINDFQISIDTNNLEQFLSINGESQKIWHLSNRGVLSYTDLTPDYLWMHYDKNKSEQQWKNTFRKIKNNGFETIIIGGGAEGIASIIPYAIEYDLDVQAWFWTVNNGSMVEEHPEWYSVNRLGESCADNPPYVGYYRFLCPGLPQVKKYIATEFTKYASINDLSAVSMDYVRYVDVFLPSALQPKYDLVQDTIMAEFDYGYHPYMLAEFEATFGFSPNKNILTAKEASLWLDFRAAKVKEIVDTLAQIAHAYNIDITASVFPTPQMSKTMVMQNWGEWDIDMILPMAYYNFYDSDVNWLDTVCKANNQQSLSPYTIALYNPGISNIAELEEAIRICYSQTKKGIAIFDYRSISDKRWQFFRKRL